MKLGLLIVGCAVAPCAPAQIQCLTVTGPQILGSDLARAVPALAGLPAHTPLAPAPLPGSTRVFSASELQSVATRFSLTIGAPSEVCFRFATETLKTEQVLQAMREALRIPDAKIEILETSTGLVPAGRLEFKTQNLGSPSGADQQPAVIWRGDIVYAGDRRFPIWLKARITAPVSRIVATEPLRSGSIIKAAQLRQEIIEGFPVAANTIFSIEQIAGMIAVRPVAAGSEIRLDNLTRPNEVNRGDLVHVEVQFGAAHLSLTGRAESAGHTGDVISVRNQESSKVFRALVEGTGKVIVEPGVSERQ